MADKTFTTATLSSADVNTYLSHTGDGWNNWTPAVVQSGAVTVSITHARYFRAGRFITFYTALTVTGSGTGSNNVTMSLPVTAAAFGFTIPGGGLIYDTSEVTNYPGIPYLASTTAIGLVPAASNAIGLLGASDFSAALAVGDLIQIAGCYESAT